MLKFVDVTEECIEHGLRGDCNACPIARAVQVHFPDYLIDVICDRVSVYPSDAKPRDAKPLSDPDHRSDYDKPAFFTANLPDDASYFMEEFDMGEPVRPFWMELDFQEVKHD